MELSIIIPTYRRSREVVRLVQSLVKPLVGVSAEILIVGASEETTMAGLELVGLSGISIRQISTEAKGVNAKRNLGIANARGKIAVLLDDDCEVSQIDFFKRHLDLHQNQAVVLGGGRYENCPSGPFASAYARNYQRWVKQYKDSIYPPLVGGNLSLKLRGPNDWIRFDESIQFGGAERELVVRLIRQGRAVAYDSNLVIKHHVKMGPLGFLRKAFLQGRSESKIFPTRNRPKLPVMTHGAGILDFLFVYAFNAGVSYFHAQSSRKNWSRGTSAVSILYPFVDTLLYGPLALSAKFWRTRAKIHLIIFKPYYFFKFQLENRWPRIKRRYSWSRAK